MKDEEILLMRYGEMQDMIACFAIENGGAEQEMNRKITYEEAMRMK